MKPLKREIKQNQVLAEQLYAIGNSHAMYFAGVIAEPNTMTEQDYNCWIDRAYFVAVTLAEEAIGEQLAIKWIVSGEELKMSAGWSCYCWMLENRKDKSFHHETIEKEKQKGRIGFKRKYVRC